MMVIADLPSTSQSSQLSSSNLDSRRSRTQSSGTSDHDHKHNEDDDDEKYDDDEDDEDDDDDTDIVEALGDEGNVRSKLLLILLHPSLAKELPAFVFVFFALLFVSVFLYLSHLI